MEQIPRQVPELFPRVCGIHGWKKCGTRRRSSVQVTGLINLRKEMTHLINVACWGVLGFITTRLSIKMKNITVVMFTMMTPAKCLPITNKSFNSRLNSKFYDKFDRIF